jgi:O-antigen/teichoic acid export membrane protein
MSSIVVQIKRQIKDPLYRNSLFLMANTAVTTGLGFFFWVVVARFYTEAEVGLASAIISAVSLLALFSKLGVDVALIRFLSKAENPVGMINSCFTLSGISTLALAGIFLAGLDLWSPALGFITEDVMFILAFVLFALGWTLSGTMDFVFIARRRAEFVFTKNAIFSVLKIPLPILLVLFFRAFGIVSSWGIAIGIALVISLFFFLPRVQNGYRAVPWVNWGIIRNIWRYSAGNYLASLFAAASSFILPIMVVNLLEAEQNAYFYVAWMMAGLLFIIPGAVSQSLFAEGSHFEGELGVNVRRSFRFVFLLLIPAVILLLLLGKWLLLLFGESYSANALGLLWILGASSLFMGINNIYGSILRVEGRLKELVLICGFTTLAVLLGSYFVMPTTGIIGVGYAWMAAQGVVSVYVMLAMGSSRLRRRLWRQQ